MEQILPGKTNSSRDLIVGVMSNYDYKKVEPWVISAKRSGFKGDIAMICFNVAHSTLEALDNQGVEIYAYGQDSAGNAVFNSPRAVVVDRFRALYEFGISAKWKERYRYIVTTDVKDVIFQSDPIKFLERPEHLPDFKTINVGSGQTASVQEVLSILSRLLGLPPIAGAWPEPAAVPGSRQPPASRAAELLGYVPRVSVASGLSRVVQSLAESRQSSDPSLAEIGADE